MPDERLTVDVAALDLGFDSSCGQLPMLTFAIVDSPQNGVVAC
jgi:hypothetical protein